MGKTKTKILGIDEVEKEQKEKAKKRNELKKLEKLKDAKPVVVEAAAENANPETEEQPAVKEKKQSSKKVKSHGKKYLEVSKLIDKSKSYTPEEAAKILKKKKLETFDATIEMHINVREQGIKGEVALPHGTGKEVKIEVFSPEVEKKLLEGKLDFDVLIARPSDMKSLVKFAKVLGPKGLMPSPKKGTLVDDIAGAQKKFAAGAVNYKTEAKFPIIHQGIGKTSFTAEQIAENIAAFVKSVGFKNIEKAFVKTTMSPTIRLLIQEE